MSRTCVFLDGGYFQKVLEKDFRRAKVGFSRIGPRFSSGREDLLRTYYYNCLPYQSAKSSENERQLFSRAERFYHALRRVPNLQVRLGRLEFRGVARDTDQPIFEQERVDVQLAVDLLTLAFSKQIATAIVVAGDSDFIPVFEAAKNQGVRVVLAYGKTNQAHRDLIAVSDERVVLDDAFLEDVRLL